MAVPRCFGLMEPAERARAASGRGVALWDVTIGVRGEVLETRPAGTRRVRV